MNEIRLILLLIGGILCLGGLGAHIWVKLKLRPGPELDQWYEEFQDSHPAQLRYDRWSHLTFAAAALGLAMVFISVFI